MALSECPAEAVRKQLERVLASQGFARNERLSRFLRVVVERHLEGRDGDLKESVIGIEVFGRQPGFDPKQDSTVRSEAARLRARLAEYYAGEGSEDAVIIELPKGGYTPAFRPSGAVEKGKIRSWWPWLGGALVAFAVVVAAIGWWWVQHQSAPVTIAVLPLTNLSQDPANDYFADGLTDEIIRNLSIIDGWPCAPRPRPSSLKASRAMCVRRENNCKPITSWRVRSCAPGSSCGSMPSWFASVTTFLCGRADLTGS